jgi:hypothetical protein
MGCVAPGEKKYIMLSCDILGSYTETRSIWFVSIGL